MLLRNKLNKQIKIPEAKSTNCCFCQSNKNVKPYATNDTKVYLCYLCNMVTSYNPNYTKMCFLGYSDLPQEEIIKKTHEFYEKNKSIPFAHELDLNIELVNLSVYIFSLFSDITLSQKIKVFFTSEVQDHMEDEVDMMFKIFTGKKDSYLKYINTAYDEYEFTEEEKIIIENEKTRIKKENYFFVMSTIEQELSDRETTVYV